MELVSVGDRWREIQLLKGLQSCKTMNSEVAEVLLPPRSAALQQSIATSSHSGVKWLEKNICGIKTNLHWTCKMIASQLHLAANGLTHVPIDGESFMTHRAAHQQWAVEMFWVAPMMSVAKYNLHLRPATIIARRCSLARYKLSSINQPFAVCILRRRRHLKIVSGGSNSVYISHHVDAVMQFPRHILTVTGLLSIFWELINPPPSSCLTILWAWRFPLSWADDSLLQSTEVKCKPFKGFSWWRKITNNMTLK